MTRLVRLASLALVCALGTRTSAHAQVPPELLAADSLARYIEAAELSPELAGLLDETLDLPTVSAALASVRDYLAGHPEDPVALILSVRLGRVHDLLVYRDDVGRAFTEPGAEQPAPPTFARHVEVLDGVLARDSLDAAAHYWLARVLVEEAMLAADLEPEPPDSAQVAATHRRVLHHAEAAVALEPDAVAPREFYAMLLVGDDRLDAAAEVLGHASTAGSLLHLLIEDVRAFAPPDGAEHDVALASFLAMTGMMGVADSEQPELMMYLDARLSAWSAPAALADVEAHYRARWPDALFFPAEGWEGAMSAAFVPAPDGWRAVGDSAQLAEAESADAEVVLLLLLPPETVAELSDVAARQGLPEGMLKSGPRVGILYMNWRRAPAREETAVPPPM